MNREPHWLVRLSTIRVLWRVFAAVLLASVLAQLAVHVHAEFGVGGRFGFYAVYGFLSCVAMVLFAKLLGTLLKRRDTYYDD